MSWWAVGTAAVGIIGGAINSSNASSAANNAASAQTAAAQSQQALSAGEYNATAGTYAPARSLGGEASQQLAYLMGLNPNLDTTGYNITPQISANGTVSYVDTHGNPVNQSGQPLDANGNVSAGAVVGGQAGPGTQAPGTTGAGGIVNSNVPGTATTGGTPSMATAQGVTMTPGGPGGQPTSSVASPGTTGTPNTTNGGFGSLMTPITADTLQNTPGYQFTLGTNEDMINNQLSAAGHGAASTGTLDAAMNYATGLAGTTYNSVVANTNATNQLNYNELQGIISGGAQANSGVATAGTTATGQIGGAMGAVGNAGAAGAIGSANAVTSGIGTAIGGLNSAAGQYNTNQLINGINGGGYNSGTVSGISTNNGGANGGFSNNYGLSGGSNGLIVPSS